MVEATALEDERESRKLKITPAPKGVRKRVTFEAFKSKKRATQEFEFELGGEQMSLFYQAVSAQEWDELINANPPTNKQKAEAAATGNPASYDPEKFAPALLARVCIDPAMTVVQWKELWNSPDWNKGELNELFWSAVGLCNRGLDVNPTEADSESTGSSI